MIALSAAYLQKRLESQPVQHFFYVARALSYFFCRQLFVGVQIENHNVRLFGIFDAAAPDVKFDSAKLNLVNQTCFVFTVIPMPSFCPTGCFLKKQALETPS